MFKKSNLKIFKQEKLYKALNEQNAIQRYISRKLFSFLEASGFHLLGDHFYEPVSNLKKVKEQYQDEARSCHQISFNFELAEQEAIKILERWGTEFFDSASRYDYVETNYYFRGLDALFLYCLIRELKPESIIEIGQGVSTKISLAALEDNYQETKIQPQFISIDPYSRFNFKDLEEIQTKVELMQVSLQEVPLSLFTNLGQSDLLFVDSSHVYKFGSDVEYLFEEVYPNIAQGVYIHIHDICSPYNYPLDWLVKEKRFWNEQYYLENFLRFNQKFDIMIPVYYLSKQSKVIKTICDRICVYDDFIFRGYSFYLRKNFL